MDIAHLDLPRCLSGLIMYGSIICTHHDGRDTECPQERLRLERDGQIDILFACSVRRNGAAIDPPWPASSTTVGNLCCASAIAGRERK